jgi:hypothetical protein
MSASKHPIRKTRIKFLLKTEKENPSKKESLNDFF